MKYKITDRQLDNVIFLYLDNQDFIQIEIGGDSIYFFNSEGDKYAQIRYTKSDGWCYTYWKLVDEISRFFSLEQNDSKEVIGRWVENTIQMRVTHTGQPRGTFTELLRIPNN
jgi:hypothetical protein